MVTLDKKILIVGCGSIGKRHARVLHQLGAKKIALCDTDKNKLVDIANEIQPYDVYLSYNEALKNSFDAVFICTPPALHVKQALCAIQNGCNVFLEKPLSTSMDGIAEFENEMVRTKRLIMVGLCFRYHKGLLLVKDLIEKGRIGRLLSVRASIGEYLAECREGVDYRKIFVTDKDVGVTLDLCHEPDFVQWIVGSTPSKVTAYTGKISDLEMEGDDIAEMIINFDSKVVASVHVDFFQRVRRRKSEFIGTKGTILVDMSDWNLCHIKFFDSEANSWEHMQIPMQRDDMFREMDFEFLDCISNGRQPSIGLKDGIQLLRSFLRQKKAVKAAKLYL